MSGFDSIIELGDEGSKILAKKYNKEGLNNLLNELSKIEQNNAKILENLVNQNKEDVFSVELKIASENKNKLIQLKGMIIGAINTYNLPVTSSQGMLVPVVASKLEVMIPQNIVIQKQDLKSVNKEIDLKTSINTDKQFLYNCRQENMEVTNEVSFEIEMFFEPLAPIPLRLQHNAHPLNQEISFEIGFSI